MVGCLQKEDARPYTETSKHKGYWSVIDDSHDQPGQ